MLVDALPGSKCIKSLDVFNPEVCRSAYLDLLLLWEQGQDSMWAIHEYLGKMHSEAVSHFGYLSWMAVASQLLIVSCKLKDLCRFSFCAPFSTLIWCTHEIPLAGRWPQTLSSGKATQNRASEANAKVISHLWFSLANVSFWFILPIAGCLVIWHIYASHAYILQEPTCPVHCFHPQPLQATAN